MYLLFLSRGTEKSRFIGLCLVPSFTTLACFHGPYAPPTPPSPNSTSPAWPAPRFMSSSLLSEVPLKLIVHITAIKAPHARRPASQREPCPAGIVVETRKGNRGCRATFPGRENPMCVVLCPGPLETDRCLPQTGQKAQSLLGLRSVDASLVLKSKARKPSCA